MTTPLDLRKIPMSIVEGMSSTRPSEPHLRGESSDEHSHTSKRRGIESLTVISRQSEG